MKSIFYFFGVLLISAISLASCNNQQVATNEQAPAECPAHAHHHGNVDMEAAHPHHCAETHKKCCSEKSDTTKSCNHKCAPDCQKECCIEKADSTKADANATEDQASTCPHSVKKHCTEKTEA